MVASEDRLLLPSATLTLREGNDVQMRRLLAGISVGVVIVSPYGHTVQVWSNIIVTFDCKLVAPSVSVAVSIMCLEMSRDDIFNSCILYLVHM